MAVEFESDGTSRLKRERSEDINLLLNGGRSCVIANSEKS